MAYNLTDPGAIILSSTALGLNGVWWAISISSIFKEVMLCFWYLYLLRKNPETKGVKLIKAM